MLVARVYSRQSPRIDALQSMAMAKLYFRYGTMNSGKSIEVLRVAHNYRERDMRPLIAKPAVDTLADGDVHSRIGIAERAHLIHDGDDLSSLADGHDCLIIDEAQFLTPDQVDQLLGITLRGTPVLCYGLRTDFRTHAFPGSQRLLEVAHTIEEIKTICTCGQKAIFTARLHSDGSIILDGETVEIEALEAPKYISLCASCYNRLSGKWA